MEILDNDVDDSIIDRNCDHQMPNQTAFDDQTLSSDDETSSSDDENSDEEESSNESIDESDSNLEQSHQEPEYEKDIDDYWYNKLLYENSEITVGEAVLKVLDIYIQNRQAKKSLNHILKTMYELLPKPNKLPKTKHLLLKQLDKLFPKNDKLFEKHRICENCGFYLGKWSATPKISTCENCQSDEINAAFFEFDLGSLLKHLFEFRNLGDFFIAKAREIVDDNYITDVTSAPVYRDLKSEVIKNIYDVFLLTNTDGFVPTKSSQANIWLIQCQICNIPVANRRNFQFVAGIYYSRHKHPAMHSFFRPFVNYLITLSTSGIKWFNSKTNSYERSIVIAPISSCDAPARADVQNLQRFNGRFGCFVCEVEGETCEVGSGHNTVFIPDPRNPPEERTKARMELQAREAVEKKLEHVKGVKGPSVTSLIPYFDISKSFLPDRLHVILLGLFRMLDSCWLDPKNKGHPYYIKKSIRKEISKDLEKNRPPDTTMRTPRGLDQRKYYKGNEREELFLHYYPIVLKNRLPKKYYQHFLLSIYAIHNLSKLKILKSDIDHSENLIDLFFKDLPILYKKEKCTYNPHIATHLCKYVRLYGALWAWDTSDFEDLNGSVKSIIHGKNKIDKEIVNTLTICNAQRILKHVMSVNHQEIPSGVKGRAFPAKQLSQSEKVMISKYCDLNNINFESIQFYAVASMKKQVFTSQRYTRQIKRDNSQVCWKQESDDEKRFGIIQLFCKIEDKLLISVRELIRCKDDCKLFNQYIRFPRIHILIRESYCLHLLEEKNIMCKIIRVQDYVCIPEYTGKK